MTGYTEHIDELIAKYLLNEASAEEMKQVNAWIALSEENNKYFNQMKVLMNKSSQSDIQFNADAAWKKVKAKIDTTTEKKETKIIPISRSNTSYYLRIAAVFSAVVLISYFTIRLFSNNIETVTIAATDNVVNDTLTDGTVVFVNKNSSIASSYNSHKKTHHIQLKGEAYFDIHKEEKEELIIETQGILIKDIGTSFNVKSYDSENLVEIIVEAGEVIIYSETDKGIAVLAGEKGIYNKTTQKFSKTTFADLNVLAYKSLKFRFNNVSLSEIVDALNHVYSKPILYSKEIGQCRLTISFENENIESIAEVISETLGLTKTSTTESIVIEGKGCEE